MIEAAIFDLDGVLVDTAQYHFLAWKQIAEDLGFDLPPDENHKLKGVSRTQCLEILLEFGNLTDSVSQSERRILAERKNEIYLSYVGGMNREALLPGALECLIDFKARGVLVALGSASRNAGFILDLLDLKPYFDTIVDGNRAVRTKPDPEVFQIAARDLGKDPAHCLVIEDSQAGLDAARIGGMKTVAIGNPDELAGYDLIFSGLFETTVEKMLNQLNG